MRSAPRQGRGPVGTLAYFNARITPQFIIKNLMLRRRDDGSLRISAPHAFGSQTCTFGPDLAREITAAAVTAYQLFTEAGRAEHDNISS